MNTYRITGRSGPLVITGLVTNTVLVVALATQLPSTNTAFTGASLVSLMSVSDALRFIVITYTLLETSIGAVSRLRSFSMKVKPETREGEDVVPPPEWPASGAIEIRDVSASYA